MFGRKINVDDEFDWENPWVMKCGNDTERIKHERV